MALVGYPRSWYVLTHRPNFHDMTNRLIADVISSRIRLTDLAGASAIVLQGDLADAASSYSGETDTTTYVITTFAMKASLPSAIGQCLTFEHALFPHLDLDHIGESIELGWKGGFSLGIWIVDMVCIERSINVDDALPPQIE